MNPAATALGCRDRHRRALRLGFSLHLSAAAIKARRERDPSPPWQWAFAIAFTGVRGAVSLAAALALPFRASRRRGLSVPRPDSVRLFGVIFITLVGLGLVCRRWFGGSVSRNAGRRKHLAEH